MLNRYTSGFKGSHSQFCEGTKQKWWTALKKNSIKKRNKSLKTRSRNWDQKWEKTRAEEWAKRRKKRAQTDRKGSREEGEIGEEKENESGKRQSRGLRNEATDRQRGTMSSAVVPAESDRFTWWHICLSDSARLCNLPLKDLHGAADDTEGKDNTHTQRDYSVFQASFRLLLNVRRWPALLSTADRRDDTNRLTVFRYTFQIPALFLVYSLLCHITFNPYHFRVTVIWKWKLLKQFIFLHKTHDKLVKCDAWLWIKLLRSL